MTLSLRAKMRLMILAGIVLIGLTTLIVLYGFKRTEELRSEEHTVELMRQPRDAAYSNVPVGLFIGAGGSVMPGEGQARYEDGLVVTLMTIERVRGEHAPEGGLLVATFHLAGGNIKDPAGIDVKLSSSATQWADRGYVLTLLEIDPQEAVFSADRTEIR